MLRNSRGESAVSLLDRALALALEMSPESRSLGTQDFRAALAGYRAQMIQATEPTQLATVAQNVLDLCDKFFGRSKIYLAEREQEFQALIKMLRDALTAIAGESAQFHNRLLATGDALNLLSELDDIRILKARLSDEVVQLRQAVESREKQERAHYHDLLGRVEELETKLERTQKKASLDALTGVYNRGSFDECLKEWVAQHTKDKSKFVLAMVDLDDFKATNDEHGHQVGDRVLKCAAQVISRETREGDIVARYGGDEFVVMLENSRLKDARRRLESIAERIASNQYAYKILGEKRLVSFTVSVGIAEYIPGESEAELLRRADEAVYEAKKKGKNCVATRKSGLFEVLGGLGGLGA